MQILTPSGYKNPAVLANGDEVCGFDATSGASIINTVENIDFVDYAEWCRWWQLESEVAPFQFYRINGTFLLFREQSVWRNGSRVCHARDLTVGDVIHDDADRDVLIGSIEIIEDNSLVWYRFDISGDHSYIADGLTVHNASRFWVLGTGTWDSSTTTNWAASSNGAGGQTVPGSADSVTFDGSSGGGTVTLNFGGTITLISLTMGAFTGTWDNSVNNNNITLTTSNTTAFGNNGTATRTVKLGSATYTLSGAGVTFINNATGLTWTPGTSTITFSGASNPRTLTGASLTYGTLNIGTSTSLFSITGSNTFAAINITAPNSVTFQFSSTQIITAAINWAGSSSNLIAVNSGSLGSQASLHLAAGSVMSWCGIKDINATSGAPTATDSFNLGDNSNITINPPGGSGTSIVSSTSVIGS